LNKVAAKQHRTLCIEVHAVSCLQYWSIPVTCSNKPTIERVHVVNMEGISATGDEEEAIYDDSG